jgi:hypothetical protein
MPGYFSAFVITQPKLHKLNHRGIMAPASLSTEGQLIAGLAALHMTRKEFVSICNSLSVPVSEALVSLALIGKRTFTQWTGINLLSIMNELTALRDQHGVALNWSTSDIPNLLVQRRMQGADDE